MNEVAPVSTASHTSQPNGAETWTTARNSAGPFAPANNRK